MQQQLTHQAKIIETILIQHGLDGAHVVGGTMAPRLARYEVVARRQRLLDDWHEEITAALAATLHTGPCHVYANDGHIYVEVPHADAPTLRLLDLYRRLVDEGGRGPDTIPPVTAVLGLDLDGAPVLLRLASPRVGQALITGDAGAGKTSLACAIAASLMVHNDPRALQLALFGEGLLPFADAKHLAVPVVTRVDAAAAAMQRLAAEVKRRGQAGYTRPRLVAIVDDLDDHLLPETQAALAQVLEHGPHVGLHLVATATVPPETLAGRFPVRVTGRASDADRLLGQGDFQVVAWEQTVRIQAAYIEPDEIRRLIKGG